MSQDKELENAVHINLDKSSYTPIGESLCNDSDGGKDYYVKGYVTYKGYAINDLLIKEEDKCGKDVVTGKDVVQERFCPLEEGGIGVVDYTCPNGCKDGACLQ